MINRVEVLFEWRFEGFGVETLVDILIIRSVELLIVKLVLLVALDLLRLLLLKDRHEAGSVGVVQPDRILVEQLNE